jgi:type I restriction enzyme R subunit
LINQFRNSYNPRIVVSVDMISTGTDIKPLEALIFMRAIKSRTLFEQMRGRGCRTISDDALSAITPKVSKTRYIVFDAVGVTTRPLKFSNPPLERQPGVSLEKLIEQIVGGNYDEANLVSLAGRLGRLVKYVETPEDVEALQRLTGGTLPELAEGLLNALDYDLQLARAQTISDQANPPASALAEAELQLAQEAMQPFKSQELRNLILEFKRREKQAIDDLSQDKILFQSFDEDQARREIVSFRALLGTLK